MANPTDQHISTLLKEGQHQEAFSQMVRHFKEPIYWHIRRMVISHADADDVAQNTFLKVWRNIGSFKGDAKVYTWLYRIATNESLNFIKQNKRRLHASLDESVVQPVGSGFGFSGDEIELKLQRAILSLPDKQRAVFNLKYFEDKTYEELSEILETSVGALKASYHHAVKKIKLFLSSD